MVEQGGPGGEGLSVLCFLPAQQPIRKPLAKNCRQDALGRILIAWAGRLDVGKKKPGSAPQAEPGM